MTATSLAVAEGDPLPLLVALLVFGQPETFPQLPGSPRGNCETTWHRDCETMIVDRDCETTGQELSRPKFDLNLFFLLTLRRDGKK